MIAVVSIAGGGGRDDVEVDTPDSLSFDVERLRRSLLLGVTAQVEIESKV